MSLGERAVFLVSYALFFVIVFGNAYLLLARPAKWIEWFLARPWRPFGITVSIHDAERLRKKMRILGTFYIAVGLFILIVFALALPSASN